MLDNYKNNVVFQFGNMKIAPKLKVSVLELANTFFLFSEVKLIKDFF